MFKKLNWYALGFFRKFRALFSEKPITSRSLAFFPSLSTARGSTGAFCLRVRDFEISYERIRWPAISRNQNNGGLRGEKFRVRVVICVVYLPCLKCRRCQNIEKRLGCLWRKVTAKYFRIIRGNQVVLVWNSHVVSNLAKVA